MKLITKLTKQNVYIKYDLIPFVRILFTNHWINSNSKIIIICKEHGYFEQYAVNHLRGQGCIKCGYLNNTIKLSKTHENFIKEVTEKYGDKFDYTNTQYINSKTKHLRQGWYTKQYTLSLSTWNQIS